MKKILIVEDELLIARVYALHLEKAGYSIAGIVSNHAAAMQIIEEHQPDLFLLDIQLKKNESGIDLAKMIREISQSPIIFTTGNSLGKTNGDVIRITNCEIMIKPIDVNMLLKRIGSILN